ncbi:sigma-70 family RNA polymerase sigma factor [Variovorax sp. HJSM1_2]|uniref:sigma-70 family RNA polymerase sigma factor n=1 Tax=Variovorax sp. HJSM1_2 TaxID=3366263 RepID=UPI003BC605FC
MSSQRFTAFASVETLYQEHHGWLVSRLRAKLGNVFDAADLAQDTFVRVLAKRDAPPVDELRAPRAYLSTIAKGLVADFFRRKDLEQAYLAVLATLPEPQQPSLEARAIVLEALTAIDAMLDGLKPVVRETFLLSQLEGLSYAEIATRLDISIRSVNNHMGKAIAHCYLLAP